MSTTIELNIQPTAVFGPVRPLYAVLFCLCVFLAGCAAPNLDLSVMPLSLPERHGTPVDGVIGVDRFVDLRPRTRGSDNQKWLGLVPGVLWIDISTDMPEIYTPFSPYNSQPMESNVAESMAEVLGRGGVAQEVVFLPEDPYRQVDYRLEGVLRRTLVKERGYYYGSFAYAWLTRVLGLPYVSYDIELEIDLRLRSMATNQMVWQGKVRGHRTDKYNSVYDLAAGRDGKHLIAYNFSAILSEHVVEIIDEIKRSVGGQR
ncbi:MAG: hypothetical protein KAS94_05130 [Desulfobulbaceae bacterium]|nr:hypothetical protein [Desulfobulbaceae bacterium]